jgi:glycosyltransferase involved in cell wall biosynthesis
MGQMYGGLTEPWDLFRALAQVRAERADLEVRLEVVGHIGEHIKAAAEAQGLSSVVEFSGYLPHAEAIARVAAADVALVIVADRPGTRGVVTGKLFEYFAVGLPVLALAPLQGDAAHLVAANDAGWTVASHDVDAIAARIVALADDKRRGVVRRGAAPEVVAKYERRALTGQLAAILDGVVAPSAGSDA